MERTWNEHVPTRPRALFKHRTKIKIVYNKVSLRMEGRKYGADNWFSHKIMACKV